MDQKKGIMDGSEDEHDFNLQKQLKKGVYPVILEMKAELPGIDLQQGDSINDNSDEAYNTGDMNDLAEQSEELNVVEIM